MIKGDFELLITSVPDREKVICEIYYKNEIIAEISQETDDLLLTLYSSPTEKWWEVSFTKFQNILEEAKQFLLQGPDNESNRFIS